MISFDTRQVREDNAEMEIAIYESIPDCAKEVRQKVFIDEQGFQNEFDDADDAAAHIVLFGEDKRPVATCRIFWDIRMDSYILGRLAVIKEYRGRNIGSVMVKEAERYVRKMGGKCIALHAQCRAAAFYEKLGFEEFGDIEEDEGCPHIWMKKYL